MLSGVFHAVGAPLLRQERAVSPWRPVAFALLTTGLLWLVLDPGIPPAAPSSAAALVAILGEHGLEASTEDVTWLDGPSGLAGATRGTARALVRARTRDDPADLYIVKTRLSPEGVVLDVAGIYDVTRTSGVDEGRPILRSGRDFVAYSTSFGDTVSAVHTLDLRGAPASEYADWRRVQRWQNELTNLQQTGQRAGLIHDAYALDPTAQRVEMAWEDGGLLRVTADGREVEIDPAKGAAVRGGGWVRPVPDQKARPGNLVTWSVDRVRAMPWFGDRRMQWLKFAVFTGLDLVLRLRSQVVDTSASEVASDLGVSNAPTDIVAPPDPEIGWPPAPLSPLLSPPLPGEGRWIVLDHDPFITPAVGLPPAFVTTFVRTDRERPDTRVYVTLWDPRQIALHMVAGTVEPVSATGEAGPGLIPRVPEIMQRLVAGFNGGFQAMHGEYGMEADGVEYLPPKPYAATVLELRDGSTGFGAWPDSSVIPDDVLGFRQNLTAIVQGEKWNVWGRTWWGGTPPGWQDNIHTTRTGICLTHDGSIGYFFGADLSPEALGRGMIQAHCDFGIHLDMNPGLAGFEFYDVEREGSSRPLGRPLQPDWEYEAPIRDLPDLHVRARRMTRSMMEVNFPQYIHREARDFFYLTRRALLPGRDLDAIVTPPEPGEGVWRVKALPQHGFPYAIATTELRPSAARPLVKAHVLRIDPKAVRPAASAGTAEDTPTVVSLFAGTHGSLGLYWQDQVFVIGSATSAQATKIAAGIPPALASPAEVHAVVGVEDLDGTLDWIELDMRAPIADRMLLDSLDHLLGTLGCSRRIALEGVGKAVLGSGSGGAGSADLSGQSTNPPPPPFVRFVRGATPAARLYFAATPVVSPSVWQPLQSKRIRYFPRPSRPASSASPAGSALAPAATAAPSMAPPPASSATPSPPARGRL